jgi:hypothetical protein
MPLIFSSSPFFISHINLSFLLSNYSLNPLKDLTYIAIYDLLQDNIT